MFNLVLVEPEIPANTGNIARSCLATGAHLHLIQPLGFSLEDRYLKRAGMDYWEQVKVSLWNSLTECLAQKEADAAVYYLTTKTQRPYYSADLQAGDYLIFGRETKGLPEPLLRDHEDHLLTIPMVAGTRSLNLATSAGIVLFEGMRQLAVKRTTQ
ncbi:MAG: tRNA (cytidine(34)-2'-O)-methyltransferase [Chthoniobacteraceae bacterium]